MVAIVYPTGLAYLEREWLCKVDPDVSKARMKCIPKTDNWRKDALLLLRVALQKGNKQLLTI